MDGLQQVTFRFGAEMEVRYLPHVPRPGHYVTHGQVLWVVTSVSDDGVGATVTCELHRGDGDLVLVA
jgi:hypothetical protein